MSDICYEVERIGGTNYRPHVHVDGRTRGIAHCPDFVKEGDLIVIERNTEGPCNYRFKRTQPIDRKRERGIHSNHMLYLTHFPGGHSRRLSTPSLVVGLQPNQVSDDAYFVISQVLLNPLYYARGREKINARKLPSLESFGSLELRLGRTEISREMRIPLSDLMAAYEGKNRVEVIFFDGDETDGPVFTTVEQENAVLHAAEKGMAGFV
ncbi:TPA: hypothetical protein HA278_01310 [Candidatus Woesearchaeota archaeon]|nr:hypothetical protein [Candidatus Woesearchaeota archaeon]